MELIVMAAGLGSRFGGAKQVEPIDENGLFLIDYSIFDAVLAGFSSVVFIIRKENYELVKNTVGKRVENFVKTTYVFQEIDDGLLKKHPVLSGRKKPLGTGNAILLAKPFVKENFCVINADDFYGREAYEAVAKFFQKNKNDLDFALACYNAGDTLSGFGEVKRGVCEIKGGYLNKITESKLSLVGGQIFSENLLTGELSKISEQTKVSMNLFGFSPKLFDLLEVEFEKFLNSPETNLTCDEFLLPAVVQRGIDSGFCKVKALNSNSKWFGLTFKEDLPLVKENIKKLKEQKKYPDFLWK